MQVFYVYADDLSSRDGCVCVCLCSGALMGEASAVMRFAMMDGHSARQLVV